MTEDMTGLAEALQRAGVDQEPKPNSSTKQSGPVRSLAC